MAAGGHITIEGNVAKGFEAVRDAFLENFSRRKELGGACCVYRHGEKVVDLWGGSGTSRRGSPGRRTPWRWCTRPRRASPCPRRACRPQRVGARNAAGLSRISLGFYQSELLWRFDHPARHNVRAWMRPPRFRTKDVTTCMGSTTAQGPPLQAIYARSDIALSSAERDRRPGISPVSQLNTQPVVSPVNASPPPLAGVNASLGAGANWLALPREGLAPPIFCLLVRTPLGVLVALDASAAHRRDDAKFGEMGPDCVRDRGQLADEEMPCRMQHQARLLLPLLDRDKPHAGQATTYLALPRRWKEPSTAS